MATEGKELESIDCPVCHEHYTVPKILPCAHLLCRDCLIRWLETNSSALCPLCRTGIVDNQNSTCQSSEEVADALPTDHSMSAMVDNVRIFNKHRLCYVHTSVDATSLCLSCSIGLCQSCVEVHRRLPLTPSHVVEDLSTLTPESLAASRHASCCVHPDKDAELFCVMHGARICRICATSKHCACPEVKDLSAVLSRSKQSLAELEETLRRSVTALSKSMATLDEHLRTSENYKMAALSEIDLKCDNLSLLVEACRKRLKMLVEDAADEVKSAIDEQKNKICHKRGKVTNHLTLIKRAQRLANDTSLVAMVPELSKRIEDFDRGMSSTIDTTSFATVHVTFERKRLSRVERELARLGKLVMNPISIRKRNRWRFHDNHGASIQLTANGQTAEKKDKRNGIVLSSVSMTPDTLYEVRVDAIDPLYDGRYAMIGVAMENPSRIALPQYADELHSAIVIISNKMCVNMLWASSNYGHALNNVKAGSTMGVMIDSAQCLHLFVDGKDQGVAYRDVKHPCYVIIDFCYLLRKVTVLPVTSVQFPAPVS